MTDRYELQKCLIQASGFIQEANRHVTKVRVKGKVEALIHTLFQQLENGNYGSPMDIHSQLDSLLKEMRVLIS